MTETITNTIEITDDDYIDNMTLSTPRVTMQGEAQEQVGGTPNTGATIAPATTDDEYIDNMVINPKPQQEEKGPGFLGGVKDVVVGGLKDFGQEVKDYAIKTPMERLPDLRNNKEVVNFVFSAISPHTGALGVDKERDAREWGANAIKTLPWLFAPQTKIPLVLGKGVLAAGLSRSKRIAAGAVYMGIVQTVTSLAEGKPLKESLADGRTTAIFSLGVDLGGTATGTLGRSARRALRWASKGIRAGTKDVRKLEWLAGQVTRYKEKIATIKDKIKLVDNEADVALRETSTEINNTIRKAVPGEKFWVKTVESMRNLEDGVKKSINSAYDKLLKKAPFAKATVEDVADDIDDMLAAMKVKASGGTGESSLVKLLKRMVIDVGDETAEKKAADLLIEAIEDQGLSFKNLHHVKQFIFENAGKLKSYDDDVIKALRRGAYGIMDKLDEASGGAYKKLSSKYKEYLDLQGYLAQEFGGATGRTTIKGAREKAVAGFQDIFKAQTKTFDPAKDLIDKGVRESLEGKIGAMNQLIEFADSFGGKGTKSALKGWTDKLTARALTIGMAKEKLKMRTGELAKVGSADKAVLVAEERVMQEAISEIKKTSRQMFKDKKFTGIRALDIIALSSVVSGISDLIPDGYIKKYMSFIVPLYAVKKYGPWVSDKTIRFTDLLTRGIKKRIGTAVPNAARVSLIKLLDFIEDSDF